MVKIVGDNNDNILNGGNADDQIIGKGGNDTIDGGKGDDIILGNSGNDTIKGRQGNDTLFGGTGDDYLEGNRGMDFLSGDKGSDTLFGGLDADTFFFSLNSNVLSTGVDTVEDFAIGEDVLLMGDSSDASFGADDFTFGEVETGLAVYYGEATVVVLTGLGTMEDYSVLFGDEILPS